MPEGAVYFPRESSLALGGLSARPGLWCIHPVFCCDSRDRVRPAGAVPQGSQSLGCRYRAHT